MRSWIDAACRGSRGSAPGSRRAGDVGPLGPLPVDVESRRAERGVDGEDLGVADVADGPGLGDLRPRRPGHVDVHHRRAAWRRRGTARWPRPPGGRSCPRARRSPRRARSRRTGTVPRCEMPGVTGRHQRMGLCVGLEAEPVTGVHRRTLRSGADTHGPSDRSEPPDRVRSDGRTSAARHRRRRSTRLPVHDRHAVAGGRLLARRRLPSGERSPSEELDAVLGAIEAQRPQRLLVPRRRRRPGRGAAGRRVAAVRRRADRRQGARPGRGLARHRGVRSCSPTAIGDHTATMSGALEAAGVVKVGPDDRQRVRRASTSASPSSTASPTTRGSTAARPAARRAARRPRSPAASCPSPPGATAAARSASPPASAAWSA